MSAWAHQSVRRLEAALARVRALLAEGPDAPVDDPAADAPNALDALCARLGLSAFERDVLVLAAGWEVDGQTHRAIEACDASGRGIMTFGLALRMIPGSHWDALSPDAPLRRHGLVDVAEGGLSSARLRCPERVALYLVGVRATPTGAWDLQPDPPPPGPLAPSHDAVADHILSTLLAAEGAVDRVVLHGSDRDVQRAIVHRLARSLSSPVVRLGLARLGAWSSKADDFLRVWRREVALDASVLVIDAHDPPPDVRLESHRDLIDALDGLVVVLAPDQQRLGRTGVVVEVQRASRAEQVAAWAEGLVEVGDRVGAPGWAAEVAEELTTHFVAGGAVVAGVRAQALASLGDAVDADRARQAVWEAARQQTRPRMEGLARRIPTRASWDDLIVPDVVTERLREVVGHVVHRDLVHETWGFSAGSGRGRGTSVLLAGPSGTGKTLAAEVMAHAMGLDLCRVDLSSVVSKYIGETESNLAAVFDAAEQGGVVLLFDEADALFGKRSQVKDAHDRHANVEVSYLLQRLESFHGLAVLTTNLKDDVDHAFLRRFHAVIDLPFPDAELRRRLWRRAFPPDAPLAPGLAAELDRLAELPLSGGNIRSAAINAAFQAALGERVIDRAALQRALRLEYAKHQQPFHDPFRGPA